MEWKKRYEEARARLLRDEDIRIENRGLFQRFFEWEEYKLKRINRLSGLDDGTCKTLLYYVSRLRTVNRWFGNKPWKDLTREDIKRVYDDLEDGRITNRTGQPFKGKDSYYRKILRGKPFELAGKKDLAREVMEFYSWERGGAVRFIRESEFRKLVDVVPQVRHKAFLWVAWDLGENVSSILLLRPRDFSRGVNEHTGLAEYSINFRRETLKRSRTPRTEFTNYPETVAMLDQVLTGPSDETRVFAFGARMAEKVLDRACRVTGVVCLPNGEHVTPKDLRSSMACDLLSKGWTTDEVNQRLGHKPSSREIDKYVNWLALDRKKPKRKFHEAQNQTLQVEIKQLREREGLMQQRQRSLQAQVDEFEEILEANNRKMFEQVAELVRSLRLDAATPGPRIRKA